VDRLTVEGDAGAGYLDHALGEVVRSELVVLRCGLKLGPDLASSIDKLDEPVDIGVHFVEFVTDLCERRSVSVESVRCTADVERQRAIRNQLCNYLAHLLLPSWVLM